MAALRSRCGHYIFALWFLSSTLTIQLGATPSGLTSAHLHRILWAGVQPTLDPYEQAHCANPGREEFRLMMYASVCVTVG